MQTYISFKLLCKCVKFKMQWFATKEKLEYREKKIITSKRLIFFEQFDNSFLYSVEFATE